MAPKSKTSSKPRANLSFLHHIENKQIKDGKVLLVQEEIVRDGPKGIYFKFYQKKDDKIIKITGIQDAKGNFTVKITKDGDAKEKPDLSMKETLAMIDKIKELSFAVKYLEKAKQKGGKWRYSRSSSRKKSTKKKSTKKKASKKRKRTKKKSTKKKASSRK